MYFVLRDVSEIYTQQLNYKIKFKKKKQFHRQQQKVCRSEFLMYNEKLKVA